MSGTGKRLRFEILKRDAFKCVYCGANPLSGALLQVDHVIPTSKGGTDDPGNLVTSCQACNGGKSNIPLDQQQIAPSPSSSDIREHAAQIDEYLAAQREVLAARQRVVDELLDRWCSLSGRDVVPSNLDAQIPGMLKDFSILDLVEAMEITHANMFEANETTRLRYMHGILNRRRREREL